MPMAFVQKVSAAELVGSETTLTFDDALTPGNVVVIWHTPRHTAHPTTPTLPASGWTAHPDGEADASGHGGAMFWRIVEPGDGQTVEAAVGGGSAGWAIAAEFSGIGAPDDSSETTGSGSSLASTAVTPSGPSIVVGGFIVNHATAAISATGSWTEIDEGSNTLQPTGWMGYQVLSSPSGSYTVTATASVSEAWGSQVLSFPAAEPVPATGVGID